MRPSLPMAWFDLCIAPSHDFPKPPKRANVIAIQGALNRVLPPLVSGRSGKIILIGGPSSSHGWNGENLLTALTEISTNGSWQLTDSRRTPAGFIGEIATHLPEIEIFPHQQTPPKWLPGKLAMAAEVWVTEDSVSMVYEALSSGANVGLLPMPQNRKNSRGLRGLKQLTDEGFLTPFKEWQTTHQIRKPPSILRETDRCAEVSIQKLSL